MDISIDGELDFSFSFGFCFVGGFVQTKTLEEIQGEKNVPPIKAVRSLNC